MYIKSAYYPFLETSTKTVSGFKINVYEIHQCILYPRMSSPSLLHISAVYDSVDYTKDPYNRVLEIANENNEVVCVIVLTHSADKYTGIAIDDIGYCGELELTKESYDAFCTIPDGLPIESDAFIFDPACVYFIPKQKTASVLFDGIPVTKIIADSDNESTHLTIDNNGNFIFTDNTVMPSDRTPITWINGNKIVQDAICIINTPESTIHVETKGGVVNIGRMGDL